jgi:multiple sugar transport system substrate-binding protein
MWDANQLPAYQRCADDFEAKNPDIDIAIEQVGWDYYWGRLLAAFVANAAPDVFVDHTSKYGDYTSRGLIEPLDDLIARDGPDLSQFVKGTGDLWVGDDGKRYGLPKDFDAVGIFYNAKMARDAGITPEQMQNLTWNPQDGGTYEKVLARLSVDVNGVRGDEPGFDPRHVATYGIGIDYPPGAGSGQTNPCGALTSTTTTPASRRPSPGGAASSTRATCRRWSWQWAANCPSRSRRAGMRWSPRAPGTSPRSRSSAASSWPPRPRRSARRGSGPR